MRRMSDWPKLQSEKMGNCPAGEWVPSTETENQMDGEACFNVIHPQHGGVHELDAGKFQLLLVRRNTLLVLKRALHFCRAGCQQHLHRVYFGG